MDDKTREFAKLAVTVVCLLATALFLWRYVQGRTPAGIEALAPGQAVSLLCVNASCNQQSEMDKRRYYQEAEKQLRKNPQQSQAVLACPACGKNSLCRVVHCPKCEHTFRYGGMPREAADRCPKCRFSQTEIDRKQSSRKES